MIFQVALQTKMWRNKRMKMHLQKLKKKTFWENYTFTEYNLSLSITQWNDDVLLFNIFFPAPVDLDCTRIGHWSKLEKLNRHCNGIFIFFSSQIFTQQLNLI